MSVPTNFIIPQSVNTNFVQRVNVNKVAGINVFVSRGYNPDVDTGATEWVNPLGIQIIFPATPFTAVVVSTSANDAFPAGTGTRVVLLEGLNANWDVTTELILMNGLTNVNSVNTYMRIRKITSVSSGSGLTNAGQITASLNANFQQIMRIGTCVSETLCYNSPRGKVGMLMKYGIQCLKPAGGGSPILQFYGYSMPFGTNSWILTIFNQLDASVATSYLENIEFAQTVPEKSDTETRVVTDTNNTAINVLAVWLEVDPLLLQSS